MKQIFDINRFGKYFLYDLRDAKNHYWLSLIIEGCLPVILFFFFEVFSLLFSGHADPFPTSMHVMPFAFALIGVAFSFSSKVYGGLTDKKKGSAWLLLPASTFEKWLSIILMTCVVIPLCLAVLLLGTDGILSLLFPGAYGQSISHLIDFNVKKKILEATDGIVQFNIGTLGYLSWIQAVLVFTLGAIFFKRAKVAKTILTLFLVQMAFSILSLSFGRLIGFDSFAEYFSRIEDGESAMNFLSNVVVLANVTEWLVAALLAGGIFLRLKTLKH